MNVKENFIATLRKTYPGLTQKPLEEIISDNLISPFIVELPLKVLLQAQSFIHNIFKMRDQDSYLNHYQNLITEKQLVDPRNKSILMSYDFHIDENENLKLIEINTNAAFLALGEQMYSSRGIQMPVADFNINEIRSNIEEELRLQGKEISSPLKVAIIDENPTQQRLFIEFLVFEELFRSWGWDTRILDYRDLFQDFQPEFIYNRFTDFFLTEPSSHTLRNKFIQRDICLSPNPFEYFLLADKQRMIDWMETGFLESHGFTGPDLQLLQLCLPKSYNVNAENSAEIWSKRKSLFFKPKNAFGSKQSFRGGSISHKAFQETLAENMIAQEFVPAPEKIFETPTGPQKFKFDLRCYAYKGRLQLVIARLYQGQVTNLRTPLGGFAPVIFQ